ncbi:MAG: hypothetical protein IIX15_01210, partial [Clostridia bacterium]|nr:hypothetical protein [Clostridia bacterium]
EPFSPDCSEEGYTLNRCKDCGYEYKSNFVSPTGHALSASVTNPTCTAQGFTVYSCSGCDFSYTSDYTAPVGHTLKRQTTEPTCDAQGYTKYRCDCGYAYVSDVCSPLGHNPRSATYAPSCDGVGYTEHTCLRCSLVWTSDVIEPHGHDFEVSSVNVSTDNAAGYSTFTCRKCGFAYSDALYYSEVFTGAYAPSSTPLAQGVDISFWNHLTDGNGNYLPLDFAAIKQAGFSFVILKAGSTPRTGADGLPAGGIDPVFEMNYAAARAAGLDVGAYFYTYSTTLEDTKRDAELLLSWLDGKQFEYPIYFDVEESSIQSTLTREQIGELCITFISTLQENRYFGAVYTNHNWLVNHHDTAKLVYLFDVWYARYASGDGPHAWNVSSYGRQMGMWQYTMAGKIPAISATTNFDFNYAYKDYPSIMRDLGYNGYPVPTLH